MTPLRRWKMFALTLFCSRGTNQSYNLKFTPNILLKEERNRGFHKIMSTSFSGRKNIYYDRKSATPQTEI